MVGVCGESENRNVWLENVVAMWSEERCPVVNVCGCRTGLWAPVRPRVKYWNLKQEGLVGADEESGWVINDPTAAIRPAL